MSNKIKVHGLYFSPYVIPVKALCEANSIDFEDKETDITSPSAPHKTPEYLKMNPMHTVPAMDDNGYYMWESKAIMAYICNKYSLDDLYPQHSVKFANCQTGFELQKTFHSEVFANYVYHLAGFAPAPSDAAKSTADKKIEGVLIPALKVMLDDNQFLGGANPNLADLAFLGTLVAVFAPATSHKKSPKTEMAKVFKKDHITILENYYSALKGWKTLSAVSKAEEAWTGIYNKQA